MEIKEEDFINIIKDNKLRIYRMCKFYASRDYEPEDLFQEVIYQVWKSRENFKGKSKLSTWVYRIALNVCYKSIITHEKKKETFVKLDHLKIEEIKHSTASEEEEQLNNLRACINQLDKADQSVVILVLEELSYKDIGDILSV
jgi:RNA polymerase sigma-70 factor (ECF subfamily)